MYNKNNNVKIRGWIGDIIAIAVLTIPIAAILFSMGVIGDVFKVPGIGIFAERVITDKSCKAQPNLSTTIPTSILLAFSTVYGVKRRSKRYLYAIIVIVGAYAVAGAVTYAVAGALYCYFGCPPICNGNVSGCTGITFDCRCK